MQTVLKKKLPIILVPVLLILIVLFFETIASAETYLDPVSGIRWVYTINDDDTCTITSSSYASGVVVIPEKIGSYKVTALGAGGMNNIFGGNSNNTVTSVTIPNSVIAINDGAFRSSKMLESVIIPDSVEFIGQFAFYNCTELTSITIPNSVTTISFGAFQSCSKLESVIIPDSIISIGPQVFCDCTSLTSVTIPDSVTSIGEYTFNGCTNLASINLPKAITSLSNSLFWGCTSLISITIPASVTSIGSYAFYDCTILTSIYFKGDAPTFERNALPDTEIITLHYSDKKNWTVTGGKFWANEYDFNYYNAVADMPAVIFNSNGGTDVPLQVLMHGEKAVRPTNPTKEGLTFVAWYRDADFNTLWDFDNDTIGDTDITLYAMWMLSDEVFAVGDPLHLRSQFMNLTQIQPYHISVDCHLAKIGAHILRTV